MMKLAPAPDFTGALPRPEKPAPQRHPPAAVHGQPDPESPMKGRLLKPAELDADLIARWKQFCDADALYHNPFYRPQFTQAVALSRPDARVAVLEKGGDIVGFLPFHLTRAGTGKPIGGHINDYHGPILAPGFAPTGQALLKASGIAAYDYNHLPTALTTLAAGAHTFAISPQMDLSEGFDAYVARRDSRWTKAQREVRRRHRKTESEIGPIRFTFQETSDAIYERHVAMKNAQYARMGLRMALGEGWVGQVLERLRHMQEPDFAGVMSTLHAGDRLIAAHFGIRSANVLHWWFPSYDLAAYKLGPGINLVNQCAMAASDHGVTTIDFGKGDEDFKLHFADRQVPLCEGSICHSGSLAATLRQGTNALASLAERLPLGRFRTYPRRAVARLVSGVTLPEMA
jgi:CelD/BcsL family acetyltransferase involved in cellulose biosynthesis